MGWIVELTDDGMRIRGIPSVPWQVNFERSCKFEDFKRFPSFNTLTKDKFQDKLLFNSIPNIGKPVEQNMRKETL